MEKVDLLSFPESESIYHIHLIAVCGTAMGALASMLKEMGFHVTGSDQNVYPPMSDFLKGQGIAIFKGFHASNLDPKPDLVVVGNAVSKENVEVQAMQAQQLAYCSMPQAINRFVAGDKGQILVTGTHGKTTTSSFIAWLLHCAELAPSFLIGGILSNFNSNYTVGKGGWVVLEGDEYDTAYFDKGPKFLHYVPSVAIITSVEFDHADIFRDLAHVKQVFGSLIMNLPIQAHLLIFDNDKNIDDLLRRHPFRAITYGFKKQSDWQIGKVNIEPPFTFFEVYQKGRPYAAFKTRMIGSHNLLNLLAGIAVGHHLKIDKQIIAEALERFKGVRRRQEVRGIKNNIVVIDDFAHHPTAVKATIEAIKSFYGRRRLVAVFEPRTNSSRRNVFQFVYPGCFDAADLVCIRQAPNLDKIPKQERFSSDKLVSDLVQRGLKAHFFNDTDAILTFLTHQAKPDDIILIMSNGGFDNIHQRLLDQL
jgi:UDP-N-acetylmuramate: L-alanyl-gamma-D-glutamyl-meso-diaminopimelate ligase